MPWNIYVESKFFIILNCGCLRNVRRMQIADIMTGKDSHPSHTFFFIVPINATRFLLGLQVHYANNNKYSSIGKISSLWIKAYKMCLYDIMLQLKLFYLEPRIHVEYNVSSAVYSVLAPFIRDELLFSSICSCVFC